MIGSLKMSCKHNFESDQPASGARAAGTGDEEGRRVRQRLENAQCHWEGRLDEWKRHADEECGLQVITCDITGCNIRCRRTCNEMADHRRSDACIQARIEARVSAAVAAVEEKFVSIRGHEKKTREILHINFCKHVEKINRLRAHLSSLHEAHKQLEAKQAEFKCNFLKSHQSLEGKHEGLERKYKELESKHKELEMKHEELGRKHEALEKKFEERMEKFQEKNNVIAKELVHFEANKGGHVLSFCREWMLHKPDPVFDFVVYRGPVEYETVTTATNDSKDRLANQRTAKDLTVLLIGIPGPKRTPWEGGLYPVLFKWNPKKVNDDPPICQFPPDFQHPNILRSGIICLSTLAKGSGWSPDITIPEIMFDIQQLLAHPNVYAISHLDVSERYLHSVDNYDRIAREVAQQYNPDRFLEEAKTAFSSSAKRKDSRTAVHLHVGAEQIPSIIVEDPLRAPREAPSEPILFGDRHPVHERRCSCSCCAWGTATGSWDARLEMRFLWGVGG